MIQTTSTIDKKHQIYLFGSVNDCERAKAHSFSAEKEHEKYI